MQGVNIVKDIVQWLVTWMNCGQMDEWIKIIFGMGATVGHGYIMLI